jgi:hypothetical protein
VNVRSTLLGLTVTDSCHWRCVLLLLLLGQMLSARPVVALHHADSRPSASCDVHEFALHPTLQSPSSASRPSNFCIPFLNDGPGFHIRLATRPPSRVDPLTCDPCWKGFHTGLNSIYIGRRFIHCRSNWPQVSTSIDNYH